MPRVESGHQFPGSLASTVTSYSLSQEALKKRRNKLVLQTVGGLPLLIAVEAVIVYSYAGLSSQFWSFLSLSALLSIAIIALGTYRSISHQSKIWQTLRVVMGRNYVAVKLEGGGEMRVRRDQVCAIQETATGLTLSTLEKPTALLIPVELEPAAYSEIRTALGTWCAIEPGPRRRRITVSRNMFLSAVWLAGMIILLAPAVWLIWAAILFMVGLCGFWGYWLLHHSKGSDPASTRNSVAAIGVLLLISATKAFAVLGGFEVVRNLTGK